MQTLRLAVLCGFFLGSFLVSALSDTVLRFAHATTGGPDKAALDQAILQFEGASPGVRVQQIVMDDDIYQDMGLLAMFTGGNPPDIYFQWGGWLVGEYARKGWACDLTESLEQESWKDRFVENIWEGATYQDRIYMIPTDISLTTLYWYDKKAFQRAGIGEPSTWEELLACCEALKKIGVVPFSFGNQEKWPAGNWVAHLVSRVAGEEKYEQVMRLEKGTSFLDPDFIKAFTMVKEMADKGYFNRGLNGMSAVEGQILFFNGIAAMHPMGSWLIAAAQESAPPGFDYTCFNMPHIPGSKGDPTSVISLATGYMIQANTKHAEQAIALLRHITTVDVQKEMVKAGVYSSVKGSISEKESPPQLKKAMEIYGASKAQIYAPDVGFNLEVADAFLAAAAWVMDGKKSAREALELCEKKVQRLRK